MTFDIRHGSAEDAAAVSFLEKIIFPDPWRTEDILSFISSDCHGLLVCSCRETVCGYAVYSSVAGEAELLRIGVAPDMRRRGIGGRLLDGITSHIRLEGASVMFLEVRASNAPAAALYRSRGFSDLSLRRNYYRDPIEDALIMKLELGI